MDGLFWNQLVLVHYRVSTHMKENDGDLLDIDISHDML